jgi:divalent metal cation (Fe/Co/Zn/Cd) transporter
MVALIVLIVSYRLGKRSIEVLLDYPPREKVSKIGSILKSLPEINSFRSLKVRTAGADTFVSVTVTMNSQLRLSSAHKICDTVESEIRKEIDRCDVFVHVEPVDQVK